MTVWTTAVVALSQPPVIWYKLNEASGATATDAMGGVNGTYTGTITRSVASIVPGNAGDTCITCTAGRVSTPDPGTGGPVPWNYMATLVFTYKGTAASGLLLGSGGSGAVQRTSVSRVGADIAVEFRGTDNVAVWTGGAATLCDGNAHLVILRVNRTGSPGSYSYQQSLIVDGTVRATATAAGSGDVQGGWALGGTPSANGAQGTYDEFLLFDEYMSDADAAALWQAWQNIPVGSPPNVPTSLSVTPSLDGTELQLDWAAPSGGFAATGYKVRIDGGSATDVGNVFSHDFTGLTPDTTHTLEVRAYNAFGDGSWASISGTTTGPPDTPTGLVVTPSADGTELQLDWTAPGGDPETGYDVRINGGSPTDVGNVLSHDFTGLTPATSYTLEVRAYNAAGDSAWASIGGTTTAPPGTPTGLSETVLSPTSVELDWTASTGSPDGYEVRVDGGTATDVGNVLTHTFTGLYPGSSPLLEVRAYNEAGFSAWASVEPDTPPVTESEYTAEIILGDHEWTITSGECEFGDVVVLDGLRIGWQADESKPWPTQPNPVECSLGLYVDDVVNLEDVVIGTPLSIVLTDVADTVFATFHGRVARMTAQAKANGPVGLYMLYSVSAVDYTVDLAEYPVTVLTEWPAESGEDRFSRIVAAIGYPVTPPADTGTAAFEAWPAGTTDALTLLMSHLDQVAVDNGDGPQRYIVVPVVDGTELIGFECVLQDRAVDAGLLPGVLDVVDGVLTLVFPDLDAEGVVDACAVDLAATWNRLKYRAVNHVTVAGSTVTGEAIRGGTAPVRLTLPATLTDQAAADLMAAMYLPDTDEADGWVADTFRLLAWQQPAAITPAWFPDHRTDPAVTAVYVMPIAILNIAPAVNLAGEVYAGQLVKVDLQIAERRITVDFSLRRRLPESSGAGALTWDDVSALWPALTWDDVDPALSWYDARLGKAP